MVRTLAAKALVTVVATFASVAGIMSSLVVSDALFTSDIVTVQAAAAQTIENHSAATITVN